MNKLNLHTANKADDNFIKLAELFPNAVTETMVDGVLTRAIDKDVLMQEISAQVVEGGEERYQFNWPDKKKSVLLANAPNYNTLRPCVEESVNFDTTENLYIEGDNLDVLKLLQETYLGKVKMIYIDPPYNTGKDFVYADDFKQSVDEYMELTEQYDEDGNRMFENKDTNGRFHTDWLNMIYPRLRLARDLLRDDGVIFISIDDNEVANLRKICDEVFGERNFVAQFVWNSSTGGGIRSKLVNKNHEYALLYAKNKEILPMFFAPLSLEAIKQYNKKDEKGIYREKDFAWKNESNNDNQKYSIKCPDGSYIKPKSGYLFRFVEETFLEYLKKGYVVFKETTSGPMIDPDGNQAKWNIYIKKYLENGMGAPTSLIPKSIVGISNLGTDTIQDLFGERLFNNSKSIDYLHYLINIGLRNNDLILDFFSGSATTAHAVMQLNAEDGGNRKFIMVQLPEVCDEKSEAFKAGYKNICEIGKERIRRAGEKIKTETLEFNKKIKDDTAPRKVPDIGFRVLKCDSTNMKDVYYYPQDVDQNQLDMLTDNIKDDRTPEDLLFQVMLDLGVPLSCKIESELVDARKIFVVYQGDIVYLIACFDEKVSSEVVTAIAKQKPYYAVFRDSSMESDSVMTSFEQIFEAYSKDTVRKVL